jgi:hypothetical protein
MFLTLLTRIKQPHCLDAAQQFQHAGQAQIQAPGVKRAPQLENKRQRLFSAAGNALGRRPKHRNLGALFGCGSAALSLCGFMAPLDPGKQANVLFLETQPRATGP